MDRLHELVKADTIQRLLWHDERSFDNPRSPRTHREHARTTIVGKPAKATQNLDTPRRTPPRRHHHSFPRSAWERAFPIVPPMVTSTIGGIRRGVSDESVVTEDGVRSGGWPLWFASMCGQHEIAELLLARGADVNTVAGCCGDALGRAGDAQMKALLLKHGAPITVEQIPDGEQGREIAKAILDGTVTGYSLDVANPTRTDLAEQMLWATGDAEIARLCLPHMMTRPRDDPWWN